MVAQNTNKMKYVAGMYAGRTKTGASAAQIAEKCIRKWEEKRAAALKEKESSAQGNHCISFSRKIGVGALEIADLVAEKTGLQVVDREILEHIANDSNLSQTTVDCFDERHPGLINNFGAMLFGEKSFTMGDYMRHLLTSVYAIVEDCPTLFVGRATHLMMPRDRVLAVRFISSNEHRVKRVAGILGISEAEAGKKLDEEDRLQSEFYKKNFKKKEASPYEFDLVINRDYITEAEWAADLVERAYNLKFSKN
jgi:cytidylate kinase